MKLCHLDVLNVNFLLVCRWAGKAAEVMVVSYFWRGYQQPCDIGLSDRTSVPLNTPLTLLGQAFLSVSRHTPPSHHISLSFYFSLSLSLPMMVGQLTTNKCVCMCMCVQASALKLDSERRQHPDSVAGKEQVRALWGGPDCWPWGQCTEGPPDEIQKSKNRK